MTKSVALNWRQLKQEYRKRPFKNLYQHISKAFTILIKSLLLLVLSMLHSQVSTEGKSLSK